MRSGESTYNSSCPIRSEIHLEGDLSGRPRPSDFSPGQLRQQRGLERTDTSLHPHVPSALLTVSLHLGDDGEDGIELLISRDALGAAAWNDSQLVDVGALPCTSMSGRCPTASFIHSACTLGAPTVRQAAVYSTSRGQCATDSSVSDLWKETRA